MNRRAIAFNILALFIFGPRAESASASDKNKSEDHSKTLSSAPPEFIEPRSLKPGAQRASIFVSNIAPAILCEHEYGPWRMLHWSFQQDPISSTDFRKGVDNYLASLSLWRGPEESPEQLQERLKSLEEMGLDVSKDPSYFKQPPLSARRPLYEGLKTLFDEPRNYSSEAWNLIVDRGLLNGVRMDFRNRFKNLKDEFESLGLTCARVSGYSEAYTKETPYKDTLDRPLARHLAGSRYEAPPASKNRKRLELPSLYDFLGDYWPKNEDRFCQTLPLNIRELFYRHFARILQVRKQNFDPVQVNKLRDNDPKNDDKAIEALVGNSVSRFSVMMTRAVAESTVNPAFFAAHPPRGGPTNGEYEWNHGGRVSLIAWQTLSPQHSRYGAYRTYKEFEEGMKKDDPFDPLAVLQSSVSVIDKIAAVSSKPDHQDNWGMLNTSQDRMDPRLHQDDPIRGIFVRDIVANASKASNFKDPTYVESLMNFCGADLVYKEPRSALRARYNQLSCDPGRSYETNNKAHAKCFGMWQMLCPTIGMDFSFAAPRDYWGSSSKYPRCHEALNDIARKSILEVVDGT